jgi:hypothetical protein
MPRRTDNFGNAATRNSANRGVDGAHTSRHSPHFNWWSLGKRAWDTIGESCFNLCADYGSGGHQAF